MPKKIGYIKLRYPQHENNYETEIDSNQMFENLFKILKNYKISKLSTDEVNANNNNNDDDDSDNSDSTSKESDTSLEKVKNSNKISPVQNSAQISYLKLSFKVIAVVIVNFLIFFMAFIIVHLSNGTFKTKSNLIMPKIHHVEMKVNVREDWSDYFDDSNGTFIDLMDTRVRPCDDFYQFACGNWIKKNLAYNRFKVFDRFNELTLKHVRFLAKKLETPKCIIDSKHSDALCSAKKYYKSCKKDVARNDEKKFIRNFLKNNDGWPVTHDINYFNMTKVLSELHEHKVFPLFKMSVERNVSRLTWLHFEPSTLSTDNKTLHNFGMKLANEFEYETENLDEIMRDIVIFEHRLENIARKNSKNESIDYLNLVNCLQCNQWGLGIQVSVYLDELLGPSFNKTFGNYTIKSKDYFRQLCTTLSNTKPYIVASYLNLFTIITLLSHSKQTLVDEFEETSSVIPVITHDMNYTTMERCALETDRAFHSVTNLLFEHKYSHHVDKGDLANIFRYIRDVFKDSVKDTYYHQFLKSDSTARDDIERKVRRMRIRVVNEKDKNITINDLDDTYKDYQMTSNYLSNKIQLRRMEFKRELANVIEHNYGSFYLPIDMLNVFIDHASNKIIVPTGILYKPFCEFSDDFPSIFASIGSLLAHQLMHAFDTIGRHFSSRGEPIKDLLSDESELSNYKNELSCFVRQYESFKINNKTFINGTLTLDENVADVGGLKYSYLGLKRITEGNNRSLNTIKNNSTHNYTDAQRFFILYAQTRCALTTEVYQKYRVIGPLINSEAFANAFSCSTKSFMASYYFRCSLW